MGTPADAAMSIFHVASWTSVALTAAAAGSALAAFSLAFYPVNRFKLRKLPGPVGMPFVGNIGDFTGPSKDLTWYLIECTKRFGKVYKVWFGSTPWVIVADAAQARRILSRVMARPSLRSMFLVTASHLETVEAGLICCKGATWRVARKAFEAALMHRDALALHCTVMEQCVGRLVRRLASKVEAAAARGEPGAVLDVQPAMSDLTMDVVCSCVFGIPFNSQDADGGAASKEAEGLQLPYTPAEMMTACRQFVDGTNLESASPWMVVAALMPPWMYQPVRFLAVTLPDTKQRASLRATKVIMDTARCFLTAWQQDHPDIAGAAPGSLAAANKPSTSRINEKSFLGQLMQGRDITTGATLDEVAVIAQVFTFIMAGYETTSTNLTFLLYLLAINPDAQAKLQAEVDSRRHLLPSPAPAAGKPSDTSGLNVDTLAASFPYACACVDEALRLYPPGESALRCPPEDLEVDGVVIPAESWVQLPIFSFHRDPAVWPEPEVFKPERHLPSHAEHMDAAAKLHYFPFGHGARSCPGYKFALHEARLALVHMAARFSVSVAPQQKVPVDIRTGITITPVDGMWLRVQPR